MDLSPLTEGFVPPASIVKCLDAFCGQQAKAKQNKALILYYQSQRDCSYTKAMKDPNRAGRDPLVLWSLHVLPHPEENNKNHQ